MNILHVNYIDLPGKRFNGFDLVADLAVLGVASKQAVISKLSNSPDVVLLANQPADGLLQETLVQTERRHSMDHVLYPWGRVLARTPEFASADVVHYHVIHGHMISLLDLPALCQMKPSVWTFHDPWALTGHCIHPRECSGWLTGCAACPTLDAQYPLEKDCASRMWRLKQGVYRATDADIVVTSEFMRDLVRRSPLTSTFDHVHLIPFGIDPSRYLPDEARSSSRRRLGIAHDDFVILVRATDSEFKGLPVVIEALGAAPPSRSTTVLAVDQRGLLERLSPAYRVLELGWVDDESVYAQALSASDVFLMPSAVESFGLMALEVMAAGRVVICTQGTAVASVTRAPDCGIAIPANDPGALRTAIDELASDPAEARRRGALGRELAVTDYAHDEYLQALVDLYVSVHERPRRNS